jgi:hypothetical protein
MAIRGCVRSALAGVRHAALVSKRRLWHNTMDKHHYRTVRASRLAGASIMEDIPATVTPNADATPGHAPPPAAAFLWSASEAPVLVSLQFDLVDRLGFDVMRGFGAVPKRGAEVGGLLLGRIEAGENTRVFVEDFLLAPCSHARGPSFLLNEQDLKVFDQILAKAGRGSLSVVGFFRSNTREVLELTEEDAAVFGNRLQADPGLVLLVKPHATRPPEATFFLKRAGVLALTKAGETFTFRRKELGGGRTPRRPRYDEPALDLAAATGAAAASGLGGTVPRDLPSALSAEPAMGTPADLGVPGFGGLAPDIPKAETDAKVPPAPKTRSTWIWIPLSFIFLLLGIVLGFQIALSFRPPKPAEPAAPADPFSLHLSVSEFNSSLHLRWSPEAPAIRVANKAILHIRDGDNEKSVSLDRDDLTRGGVLYRFSTGNIAFRLEVFTNGKTSVSESVDIRMLAPDGSTETKRQ